jgi:diguanylate cyclase (GGDEF)-like protein/PAS domain S-box-containing protein
MTQSSIDNGVGMLTTHRNTAVQPTGQALESPMQTVMEVPLEQRLRIWAALTDESHEGIIVCDAAMRILFVNPAFQKITGYTPQQAIGQTAALLHSGQQDEEFYQRMWACINDAGRWQGEICNRRDDGSLYMQALRIAAVADADGSVTHYVGVFDDLTQRKRTEDRLHQLASCDPLTQLPNRKSFQDSLAQVLLAATASSRKVAVLLLDLDRFKNINESLGHDAGDALLQIIGARLLGMIRRSDVLARIGGDEFAIALPDITDAKDADAVAKKILGEIATPLELEGHEIEVSCTIGICMFPDDANSVSEMIRNADTAMYKAKKLGRNMREFYTRSMSSNARSTLDIETGLRRALKNREFTLHYQPKLDLRSGAITSVEALIRWNRPGFGLVPPGGFIPLAEERGLITEIGRWTLQEAAEQIVECDRLGLPALTMAVNLSATQFHRGGLLDAVTQTLRATGVLAQRLELEITEGIIVQDTQATITILRELHDLGIQLSIDDFGTGYSSLSYLRRFPADKIKIDRSFVSAMSEDASAAGIVRGIVELAHGLQMEVIAEGVETSEQLAKLRELNCDVVQGFLISRPLPAPQLHEFIRTWRTQS